MDRFGRTSWFWLLPVLLAVATATIWVRVAWTGSLQDLGGSGSGTGVSGLTATRVPYAQSSTVLVDTNGPTYTAATKTLAVGNLTAAAGAGGSGAITGVTLNGTGLHQYNTVIVGAGGELTDLNDLGSSGQVWTSGGAGANPSWGPATLFSGDVSTTTQQYLNDSRVGHGPMAVDAEGLGVWNAAGTVPVTISNGCVNASFNVTGSNLAASSLTATRVPYAGTAGVLVDVASMIWSSITGSTGFLYLTGAPAGNGYGVDLTGRVFKVKANPSGTTNHTAGQVIEQSSTSTTATGQYGLLIIHTGVGQGTGLANGQVNIGTFIDIHGTTVGHNVASLCQSYGSSVLNGGFIGDCGVTATCTRAVGAFGTYHASNTNGVGGYFYCGGRAVNISTFTGLAAIIGDNGTTGHAVYRGRVNGVDKVVQDGLGGLTCSNNVTTNVLSLTPGADPTTLTNGASWANSTQKTFKKQTASGTVSLVGIVYANTADSTAIANTIDETIFDTKWTTPASWGAAGKALRVRAFGKHSTTGTPTIQFGVRYGSTTLAQPQALTCANGAVDATWTVDATIVLQGTGATAAYRAQCTAGITGATDLTARARGAGTIAENAASDVGITADWSVADAANTITCESITVEVMN